MAKKKKVRCPPCDCPQVLPLWLGTYGDMVTLILTFFILILSMVTFDAKKLNEAEGSLKGALSMLSGGIKIEPDNQRIQQQADITTDPETTEEVKKVESIILDFEQNIKSSLGPSNIIDDGIEGLILRFNGKLQFEPNQIAIVDGDELLFLKRLAQVLERMPPNMHIDVIGNTDDQPIQVTPKIPNAEALSAYRALEVTRHLISNGLNPQKLTSLGAGASRPIVPNTNEENRARNRRVEFRFYPDDKLSRQKQNVLQRVIDEQNNLRQEEAPSPNLQSPTDLNPSNE